MSDASSQEIYAFSLAMLAASVEAPTETDALADASDVVADLPLDTVRRIAACLAVETVWNSRPKPSLRAFQKWVESRRSRVKDLKVVEVQSES